MAQPRFWLPNGSSEQVAAVRRCQAKNAAWFQEYKSTQKCKECGENNPDCLDFHHRPGTIKKYIVSQAVRVSKRTALKEIAKCDVLCANCHRILHAKWRNEPCLFGHGTRRLG